MGQESGEEHDFLWKAVLKGAKEGPSFNCPRGEVSCTSFVRLDSLLPGMQLFPFVALGAS